MSEQLSTNLQGMLSSSLALPGGRISSRGVTVPVDSSSWSSFFSSKFRAQCACSIQLLQLGTAMPFLTQIWSLLRQLQASHIWPEWCQWLTNRLVASLKTSQENGAFAWFGVWNLFPRHQWHVGIRSTALRTALAMFPAGRELRFMALVLGVSLQIW